MHSEFYATTRRFAWSTVGVLLFVLAPFATAQDGRALWADVATPLDAPLAELPTAPSDFRSLQLDYSGLEALLSEAPAEMVPGNVSHGLTVALPLPNGSFATYRLVESSVLAPGIQARYPSIRTYVGQDVSVPSATIRVSVTPQGLHAMGQRPEGTFYIEPVRQHELQHKMSYWHAALPPRDSNLYPADIVDEGDDAHRQMMGDLDDFVSGADVTAGSRFLHGETLRTYRIAVAATFPYTNFHSSDEPSVEETLAAIAVAINRINQIFERDLAVRFELVENNDEVIFTSPGDDPYPTSHGTPILATNTTVLNENIGSANYDIGHVFSTIPGGIATVGGVCGFNKARGSSGLSQPVNDPFVVAIVAHEIGHQFAARHTFNGTIGSCGPNRTATSAFEPGSGSTIMAYTGLCGLDNVQGSTDDYFHNHSLDQMIAFIQNGAGGTCGTTEPTDNLIPDLLVSSGPQIPIETPFRLSSGVNYEGDPAELTFVWEGMTLGPAGPPPGRAGWEDDPPYFRSFTPTSSSTRFFPRIERVVVGAGTLGEGLPSSTRQLRFRITARTNAPGAGAVRDRQIFVPVSADAGPFIVTSQAQSTTWTGGDTETITWDVANTASNTFGGENVDIFLSTDRHTDMVTGDAILLAEAVPNDGAAEIIVPNGIEATRARVFVTASTGYFWAVNSADIGIEPKDVSTEPEGDHPPVTLSPVYPNPVGVGGGRATINLRVDAGQSVNVAVYDALGRMVLQLHDGPLAAGMNHQFDLRARGLAAGTYYVRAVGDRFAEVRPMTVVH